MKVAKHWCSVICSVRRTRCEGAEHREQGAEDGRAAGRGAGGSAGRSAERKAASCCTTNGAGEVSSWLSCPEPCNDVRTADGRPCTLIVCFICSPGEQHRDAAASRDASARRTGGWGSAAPAFGAAAHGRNSQCSRQQQPLPRKAGGWLSLPSQWTRPLVYCALSSRFRSARIRHLCSQAIGGGLAAARPALSRRQPLSHEQHTVVIRAQGTADRTNHSGTSCAASVRVEPVNTCGLSPRLQTGGAHTCIVLPPQAPRLALRRLRRRLCTPQAACSCRVRRLLQVRWARGAPLVATTLQSPMHTLARMPMRVLCNDRVDQPEREQQRQRRG